MTLQADSLTDLAIDQDRQIFTDDEGDLGTVSGLDDVQQSVAISTGHVIRPLIGEPITDEQFADVESEVADVLERDPQIESVDRVEVTTVNRSSGTVELEVFTGINNSFTLEVNP